MKFESIKIKNFRTIEDEITIYFDGGLTIVGPNSSGKTNIIKAVEMFFTGFDNKRSYSFSRDFPKKLDSGQTSLVGIITLDAKDSRALKLYSDINACLDTPKNINRSVNIYLTFSKSGNPIYRIFSGEKHKENKTADFNSLQRELLTVMLNSFECHYIPSAKNTKELYDDILLPHIKSYISEIIKDRIELICSGLDEISNAIDNQLSKVGLGHIKSKFKLPNNSLDDILTSFEYYLSDPVETVIESKGMGVQSAAIFAAFSWLTKRELEMGKNSIWLIEEPESYLHPELSTSCNLMLTNLANEGCLIRTTHSLNFVPQDPRKVIGIEVVNGYTKINIYDTYMGATKSIRDSLGVRFSDFCNLGLLNVFVEGKTDRELLQWLLSNIEVRETGKYSWENVRSAEFLDFGGVTALEGFMKATYEYVSKERAVVVVLDGDDAGEKTRKTLQGFFGNKDISFNSNDHFVILKKNFSIEGLFPSSWITEANIDHPNWFKSFSYDMKGELLPFEITNEANKSQLREYLKRKAEGQSNYDWAADFIDLFELLDQSLEHRNKELAGRIK